MNEYLLIGEVLKPQGLRGEVKIKPHCADISMFEDWKTVYLAEKDGSYSPLPCALNRIHDGFVYAVLGNCASVEDAERLRARELYIDRAHAAPLQDGECYIADLIGCEAVDENGNVLGTLKEVLQHSPVDTWVFSGKRPFMAPALLSVFPDVDAEHKKISVISEKLEEVAVFED